MFRGWHFSAPSAHARDAESDSFRACASKKKEAGGGAHATTHAVALVCSHLLSSVFVTRALCEMLFFFRFLKKSRMIRGLRSGPKAISHGTALRTENERFRAAKSTINLMDSKLVIFSAKFFSFHLRDGLQPEMEPHSRYTSAIETGAWSWGSTHRGRQQALRYAENSSSNTKAAYICQAINKTCVLLAVPCYHPGTPQASPQAVGRWPL